MGIYVYVQLFHFVIKQKLTIVKQLYSNKDVKKKIQIGKKEVKLFLFGDDMILYRDNPIE